MTNGPLPGRPRQCSLRTRQPRNQALQIALHLTRGIAVQSPIEELLGNLDEFSLQRELSEQDVVTAGIPRLKVRTLESLAANHGKVMLNSELLSRVWGPEYRDDLQYLRVWVSRLRGKLEDEPSQPEIIRTRYGIGYLFEASEVPLGATA